MGFLSDLWNKASTTASNIYNTVKDTIGNVTSTVKQWAKGSIMAPGGYKYCGPGNSLEAGDPINSSDSACRQHDIDYDRFRKEKDRGRINDKELRDLVRESDDRLIDNLRKSSGRDLGSYLSELGIRAKKKAEDWGIISPEQFVT